MNAPASPAPPVPTMGVVAEYIAARDAYEDATRPTNSHGHPRSLKHGDPVLLRYRAARAALAAQDEAMVESPLVPVSSADIEAACRHACRLQSINPDQKWLRGCEETNWQRIQGTVGAALHHYAVGLRNKLWNGKPLTEIAAAQAAALPAVPEAIRFESPSKLVGGIARAGDWVIQFRPWHSRFVDERFAMGWNECRKVALAATPAHDQPEGSDNG